MGLYKKEVLEESKEEEVKEKYLMSL